jgi:hypothetical protein
MRSEKSNDENNDEMIKVLGCKQSGSTDQHKYDIVTNNLFKIDIGVVQKCQNQECQLNTNKSEPLSRFIIDNKTSIQEELDKL